MENTKEKQTPFGLSSFWLKIIATIFMTLDHFALLFLERGDPIINTGYYILRAIGKIAFPIFAYLAVEGVYHTKNIFQYLLRVGIVAIALDVVSVIGTAVFQMEYLGNVFTDIFMGILLVYLLKLKNKYSFLAVFPIAFEFLSHFHFSAITDIIFASDWGSFSIVLFLALFIARELSSYFAKRKAVADGFDPETYILYEGLKYQKVFSAIAILSVDLIYYLIWRINYLAPILPNDFVPFITYCAIGGIFILLYNGKKGYSSKLIQYSFYAYYPLHLLILIIFSYFFGILHG